MKNRKTILIAICGLSLLSTGCIEQTTKDAGTQEGSTEAAATTNAGTDSGTDTDTDAGTDTSPDAGLEIESESESKPIPNDQFKQLVEDYFEGGRDISARPEENWDDGSPNSQ